MDLIRATSRALVVQLAANRQASPLMPNACRAVSEVERGRRRKKKEILILTASQTQLSVAPSTSSLKQNYRARNTGPETRDHIAITFSAPTRNRYLMVNQYCRVSQWPFSTQF